MVGLPTGGTRGRPRRGPQQNADGLLRGAGERMTTCGKCGATVADDAASFCGICGAPLSKLQAPPTPKADPIPVEKIETGRPPPTADAPLPPLPPLAGSPEARVKRTIPAAPISAALKPIEVGPYPGLTPSPGMGADMGGPMQPLAPGPKPGIPLAPPAGAEKPFKPPKHLPAGALVDKKYAVLRVLGEGGMGVVYLARRIHTGLDVVVKAVRSELAHRADVRARARSPRAGRSRRSITPTWSTSRPSWWRGRPSTW